MPTLVRWQSKVVEQAQGGKCDEGVTSIAGIGDEDEAAIERGGEEGGKRIASSSVLDGAGDLYKLGGVGIHEAHVIRL